MMQGFEKKKGKTPNPYDFYLFQDFNSMNCLIYYSLSPHRFSDIYLFIIIIIIILFYI